jgi:hypothetical protein
MRFPLRESDIARLAHDIATGLTAHPEDFPAPPVPADAIHQALAEYNAAREAAIVASAQAVSGTQSKDDALAALVDALKTDIRYAENIFRGDDGKLQLIGWAGRRQGTASSVPGQARTLELIREGKDWVHLDWKQPTDGGEVAAYNVRRRQRDGGSWMDAGMAIESDVVLGDQEPGIEYEYHVVAVNKVGDGPPSNIVRAVL